MPIFREQTSISFYTLNGSYMCLQGAQLAMHHLLRLERKIEHLK